ncbi:hypothetical protein OHT57_11175 [Streptomyces sp. NBC_00285]|uniref:hypothetical protein n=1 Tax=Streptomyces sp. NBC_00285 TaxID=2975700 RepID=UPI002E2D72A6|nr:hypothetical protein [Streptomyces sp. NBC_00285]
MSCDTLAKAPAAPDTPDHADSPHTVPQRRPDHWPAAFAVLVRLAHHRAHRVIPLLMAGIVRYTLVTSVLGVGRYIVEKHHAHGSERTR